MVHSSGAVTVRGDATIRQAARDMAAGRVGAVVVVDEKSRAAGIVTEQDLVGGIPSGAIDSDSAVVADIMTPKPLTCRAGVPIRQA